MAASRRTKRPLIDNGDGTHTVPLTRGLVAIVDSADAPTVAAYNWFADPHRNIWYAATNVKTDAGKRLLRMHRLLVDVADREVDHVDGDGLNNRRSNLRVATHAQNMRNTRTPRSNTSGFKGVSFCKHAKKWSAHITHEGVRRFLGYHATPALAHEAYARAAESLGDEFRRVG